MIGIGMLIGAVGAFIFMFITDDWRTKRLLSQGYDNAVWHITEGGFYYDKTNKRHHVTVIEREGE